MLENKGFTINKNNLEILFSNIKELKQLILYGGDDIVKNFGGYLGFLNNTKFKIIISSIIAQEDDWGKRKIEEFFKELNSLKNNKEEKEREEFEKRTNSFLQQWNTLPHKGEYRDTNKRLQAAIDYLIDVYEDGVDIDSIRGKLEDNLHLLCDYHSYQYKKNKPTVKKTATLLYERFYSLLGEQTKERFEKYFGFKKVQQVEDFKEKFYENHHILIDKDIKGQTTMFDFDVAI